MQDIPEELKQTVNDAFLHDLLGLAKDQDKYQEELGKTIKSLQKISLKQEQNKLSQEISKLETAEIDDQRLKQLKVYD